MLCNTLGITDECRSFLTRRPPHLDSRRPTSADTLKLHDKFEGLSQPLAVRLHEVSFRSYLCHTGLLFMYKDMQSVRHIEMAADALYKAKLIHGFCLLTIGQVRHLHFCVWFAVF